MPSKNQLTGMQGVYLVAAELTRRGFVASPTSRSARGADILVTDQHCKRAYSVQVKTNAATFGFWLLNEHAREMVSPSHIYVFVNVRKKEMQVEYFVVPSKIVSRKMVVAKQRRSTWYSLSYKDAKPFENKWEFFGNPV